MNKPKIIAMWGATDCTRQPDNEPFRNVYKYRLVDCEDGEGNRMRVVEHRSVDATGSEAWIIVQGVDTENVAFRAMLADLHEDRLLINLAGIEYRTIRGRPEDSVEERPTVLSRGGSRELYYFLSQKPEYVDRDMGLWGYDATSDEWVDGQTGVRMRVMSEALDSVDMCFQRGLTTAQVSAFIERILT